MSRAAVVTGAMGAGKSLILELFRSMGLPVFGADQAARKLLEAESPCYQALRRLLGDQLLRPEGGFDRRRLAGELFQNEAKRKAVERIVHPLVRARFLKFWERERAKGSELVFYEAPLILKAEALAEFDFVILVRAPEALRLSRLIGKGLSEGDIRQRWKAQIPEAEILDQADFVISNAGFRPGPGGKAVPCEPKRHELKRQAAEILKKIRAGAAGKKKKGPGFA